MDAYFSATALTPEYAHPKEGIKLSQNSAISKYFDSYSFAIVSYQLLFGIHPFVAGYNPSSKYGDITDLLDAKKYGIYPLGTNYEIVSTIPRLHYYLFRLPDCFQNLFIETFELKRNIDISEWIDIIRSVVLTTDNISNPFFSTSKRPSILIKYHKLENTSLKEIELSWYIHNGGETSFNDTHVSNSGINIKYFIEESTLNIIAINEFGKDTAKLYINDSSKFCINCGNEYFNVEDVYCNNCGCNRITI